jgi:hypothetical protein
MRLTRVVLRGNKVMRGVIRGGEFNQGTLYAYMEISQWNPFVQLIYTNKKWEKFYKEKTVLKKYSLY